MDRKEYLKQWRLKNREKIREYNRNYILLKPQGYRREYHRNYRLNHKYDKLLATYNHIIDRCNNKKFIYYKHYGGRGIKCLWNCFEEFKKDMEESYIEHLTKYGKENTTIDRIKVDGNYCKENCRWATRLEQGKNRRNNIHITYNNKTQIIKDWSRELNLNYDTVLKRYRRGLSTDLIFKNNKINHIKRPIS